MVAGQNRGFLVGKTCRNALSPSIRKLDTIDSSDDVDSDRFDADLKDESRLRKIINGEVLQRCAEVNECCENAFRVLGFRSNPDVQILGGTNETVCRERVRTNDQEINATRVERG